ncbi:unnamed protein product [Schistosoma curassoni]|nr:unnamed protein product [Schistosoma curassoni]
MGCTFRVSGDAVASFRGLGGVDIALSTRAEQALLEWIPVNSRLYVVRLNSSVRTRKGRDTHRCLFVVSAYGPTDCSPDEVKDEFYRKLSELLYNSERSDIVLVAASSDELAPEIFKYGGSILAIRLTDILAKIWEFDVIPSGWSQSLIVPIYKKRSKSSSDNHRGISLTNTACKILASIIIDRLTKTRELQTRENQAGFRPGRGCIDHVFTIRQVLEHKHASSI